MSNIHLSSVGRTVSSPVGSNRYAAFRNDVSPLSVIGREWSGDLPLSGPIRPNDLEIDERS